MEEDKTVKNGRIKGGGGGKGISKISCYQSAKVSCIRGENERKLSERNRCRESGRLTERRTTLPEMGGLCEERFK